MINRKIPWTTQPQYPAPIDRGNPLTSGLTDVYSGATIGFNNATGNTVTVTGGGSGYSQRVVPGGKSLYTPNGGWADISVSKDWAGPNTVIALMILRGMDSNYGGLFSKNSSGTSTQLQVGRNSTFDNLYLSVENSTIGAYGSSSISGLTGVPAIVAFSHSGVTSTNGSYYLNGVKGNDTNVTLPAQNTGTGALGLGRERASNAGFDSDVDWLLFLRWNRVLAAPEIKSISDNPWQIFQPLQRRIWVGSSGTDTSVNPGTGTIAITGYAPSIAQTANQAITPNVGNIVITGYAPTISQPQAVNPGAGTITITGYAPTVTQNVDVPINPGVGTIAITGYAPAVSQTANQSITPDAGNIVITGYSPDVAQTANQAITPDVGTINITGYAPIVQQAPASQNITPGVGTITITGYAPTVEQSSPLRLGGFEYGSKVYIKRNKKIYIFDSVEEADSYIEAEAKAEEIVQQSNRTSRLARKRAREKVFKALSIEPAETIDIPSLKTLVSQLQTDFELPQWIARQDWQRVVEIYSQAMEMQDEEDLLLIL